MRAVVGVIFWLVIGLALLFTLYVSVARNSLWWGLFVRAA